MSDDRPAPSSEAERLAVALRAQALLENDPFTAESMRRSAEQIEESDARLRDELDKLQEAIAEAKAWAELARHKDALPAWMIVVCVLVVLGVLMLSMVLRGGG